MAHPPSDHFDGRRFHLNGKPAGQPLGKLLRWLITRRPPKWPKRMPPPLTDTPPERVTDGDALRVSHIGHVTFLLQTAGLNILTDPVYEERASFWSWVGPNRVVDPGIPFLHLPPVDVVLVSHGHYDHLCGRTLRALWRRHRPRIIAPLGQDETIRSFDPAIEVETLDWWRPVELSPSVKVTAVPVDHWTARGLFDRNKALWCGFVIEAPGGPVFFAGDTAFGDGRIFRELRWRYGPMRLAMLPIGAHEPRWFMAANHMSPAEAADAHRELAATHSVATHFDVFQLADEAFGAAPRELAQALAERQIPPERFRALQVGEAWSVPGLLEV